MAGTRHALSHGGASFTSLCGETLRCSTSAAERGPCNFLERCLIFASGHIRLMSPEVGIVQAGPGRHGAETERVRSTSGEMRDILGSLEERWPIWPGTGQIGADPDRRGADIGHTLSAPKSARDRPTLARLRHRLDQHLPGIGQTRPGMDIGQQDRPGSYQHRSHVDPDIAIGPDTTK